MDNQQVLSWTGPLSLASDCSESFWNQEIALKGHGIYTLSWPLNGGYLPHYIGMTEQSFVDRISQHISAFMSGKYYLYGVEALDTGKKDYIYKPKDGLSEFLRRYSELSQQLDLYFKKMSVFIAPVSEITKDELFIIEAKLTDSVYKGEYNNILDSPKPYNSRLDNEVVIVNRGDILPMGF